MADQRFRVLVVATHPVQYMAPILRRLSNHPQIELKVAYCSLRGAEASLDPEFGATVRWDIPLLDGYDWVEVPNKGSGAESFLGLINPGLWGLIHEGKIDAVLCFTGYTHVSFWIAKFASKFSRSAFLFGCDQHTLESRDGRRWKRWVKRLGWPLLYRLADHVMVSSNAARSLILSFGIPEQNITLTPLVVDNDWWIEESRKVDRDAVRKDWGAATDTRIVLFCAKLQSWKRPLDLLRAFAGANPSDALLVFAGEGPLRPQLEREAATLGIADRVIFLGFVNQSQLPAVYTSADLLVLPSEFEPFAVVVNEASCCGCPVAASDRVGSARDLISPVNPRLVFPCGDVEALAGILQEYLSDREKLANAARTARARLETWSPRESVATTVEAVQLAVRRRRRSSAGPAD